MGSLDEGYTGTSVDIGNRIQRLTVTGSINIVSSLQVGRGTVPWAMFNVHIPTEARHKLTGCYSCFVTGIATEYENDQRSYM